MRRLHRTRQMSMLVVRAAGRGWVKVFPRVDVRRFNWADGPDEIVAPEQFAVGLESWGWIGLGSKVPLFASPFGDVFFRAGDGFWWLDTVEGSLPPSSEWYVSAHVPAAFEQLLSATSEPEVAARTTQSWTLSRTTIRAGCTRLLFLRRPCSPALSR